MKPTKIKTEFTNCLHGFKHKVVYIKGWGCRCVYCGKIKSDCTGQFEDKMEV